jgi:ElaB/YqjD/DUF883 family membrane-anchored ribosome-binding protein
MADENPEVIRHQIEETNQDLKQKVSMLEEQVLGTVKGTTEAVGETVEKVKEAVSDTIESVKETVHATVENVKRTLDLSYQTQQHPWLMVGGSVAVGFATGKLVGSWRGHRRRYSTSGDGYRSRSSSSSSYPSSASTYAPAAAAPPTPSMAPAAAPTRGGILSWVQGHFQGEIQKLKEMAVGTFFGAVRDLAKQSLPDTLTPKVDEVMNNLTTKLGGTPLPSPIFPTMAGHPSHS